MKFADDKNKRVFSYARWSTEPQNLGDSERRQEEMALDWCKRNGRTLEGRSFADRGVSGWKGRNREVGALGDLLKVVAPGDTILIEDCDRWSREKPLDSLNALRDTVAKGVEIVFLKSGVRVTKENFDDPTVLFPNFFGSFLANSENEKRSFRIRQAMDARREQVRAGQAVRGRLPCWLEWNVEQNKPVVIEAKAKVVRHIFDLCLAGKGVRAIERELRDCPPIANSKRANWNSRFVHRLLKDKAVLGFYAAAEPAIQGVFPPIVSEEVFYGANSKLADRKKLTVRTACADSNLFTGLVRCGRCGHTLVRHSTRANGKIYSYLLCTGNLRKLSDCAGTGLRYDVFEQVILGLLAQEDTIVAALTAAKAAPSNLDILAAQLSDIEQQSEHILRLVEGGKAPQRALERLNELEVRENRLREQVGIETANAKASSAPVAAYRTWRSGCPVPTLTIDRAKTRNILRDIIGKIVVRLGEDEFCVYFKDGKAPMGVRIFASNVKP